MVVLALCGSVKALREYLVCPSEGGHVLLSYKTELWSLACAKL